MMTDLPNPVQDFVSRRRHGLPSPFAGSSGVKYRCLRQYFIPRLGDICMQSVHVISKLE
ncbi:hypothetical protein CBM2592_B160039 [Cupriavidus taiwanensis]|nr:hypothetical protein CBM2588_B190166 [Cupriavidus taiwanensis]SOY67522.1 hypothetical protein CBM2592_B160039 [Cupriavidus taiwanensis]SOY94881.1 hypothetical protein CBM2591_B150038 [Cupriavidus taiwanensis]SOZ28256.1 hypothetical protein CBM2608_B140156 [Cupriavidus taiwanensis]SOZ71830.1 hypothetical protein CBM2617_B180167 [Cupriavidus taiwanensis]